MRVGLHALGIGAAARPEVIRAVAVAAEEAGFATLWSGEHVVLVDEPRSRYPYSADGTIAVPPDADWLDPLLGLTFAAAVTSRIGLATGVLLLPEHNPVLVAKQAATLDVLSPGRFTLGAGIGWSAEEFAALGVPFARRAQRTAEYAAVMRTLWAEDTASFTASSPGSTGCGSIPSRYATGASPSSSGATATRRSSAQRRSATAGTPSISGPPGGYRSRWRTAARSADSCHIPGGRPTVWPSLPGCH